MRFRIDLRARARLRAVDSGPDVAGDEVEDLEHPAEVVTAELQDDVLEPELFVLSEGVDDRRHALLDEVVGEPEAQRKLDRRKRPPRLVGRLAQAAERLGDLRGRLRCRVPAIAERGDPAKSAGAVAAHPEGRMRLLHGLRREAHLAEAEELAVERGVVLSPQRFEDAQRLVGLAPALMERRAENLQLFLPPADTDADDQPAL